MKYQVTIGERVFAVERTPQGLTIDGTSIEAVWVGDHSVRIGDRILDLRGQSADGEVWRLTLDGLPAGAEVLDERGVLARAVAAAGGGTRGPSALKAPMPGLVVRVEVEEGEEVAAGQGIAIVEAMKMENELKAERGGVVSTIHVSAGDTVLKDQVLIEFEPPETS